MSAFEEWYADFLYYEGEPTKDIAKQAWNAGVTAAIAESANRISAKLEEGYAIVPVEPTEKMIEAGYNAYLNSGWIRTYEIYEAMIQAAQKEK
jgi:hypothetical protein